MPTLGVASITDDDPTPTMTIAPAAATEGQGPLRWQVSLSQPSRRMVAAFGRIVPGTATPGSDYAHVPGLEAYLEAGQTIGELVLEVVDDDAPEPTEAMSIEVNATGAD